MFGLFLSDSAILAQGIWTHPWLCSNFSRRWHSHLAPHTSLTGKCTVTTKQPNSDQIHSLKEWLVWSLHVIDHLCDLRVLLRSRSGVTQALLTHNRGSPHIWFTNRWRFQCAISCCCSNRYTNMGWVNISGLDLNSSNTVQRALTGAKALAGLSRPGKAGNMWMQKPSAQLGTSKNSLLRISTQPGYGLRNGSLHMPKILHFLITSYTSLHIPRVCWSSNCGTKVPGEALQSLSNKGSPLWTKWLV